MFWFLFWKCLFTCRTMKGATATSQERCYTSGLVWYQVCSATHNKPGIASFTCLVCFGSLSDSACSNAGAWRALQQHHRSGVIRAVSFHVRFALPPITSQALLSFTCLVCIGSLSDSACSNAGACDSVGVHTRTGTVLQKHNTSNRTRAVVCQFRCVLTQHTPLHPFIFHPALLRFLPDKLLHMLAWTLL
jgi:hypothetical protein